MCSIGKRLGLSPQKVYKWHYDRTRREEKDILANLQELKSNEWIEAHVLRACLID